MTGPDVSVTSIGVVDAERTTDLWQSRVDLFIRELRGIAINTDIDSDWRQWAGERAAQIGEMSAALRSHGR